MSSTVIKVKGISKSYKINHELQAAVGSVTFRESIMNTLKKPVELITGHIMKKEKFWALRDIDFEIEQGEVVGIIGKNGSGKSTLLKIMSRITEPTKGEIIMTGKVASLLEVGTGFHPELTGRENIYFNGSILGMKKKEIDAKFDEIVAFSEVEKFLDTPVKFYSSGMYVRLAFAVAAHLDPDILIVDEVLAVGDTAFQKKCINKMRDVAGSGKTVLFVSHSMDSVKNLCEKVVLLEKGKIVSYGETSKVIGRYLAEGHDLSTRPVSERVDRTGTGKAKLESIKVDNEVKEKRSINLTLDITNNTKKEYQNVKLSLDLQDESGNYVSNIQNALVNHKINLLPGKNQIVIKLKNINLVPGQYFLNFFVADDINNSEIFDWIEGAAKIIVPEYDFYNIGEVPFWSGKFIYIDYEFKTKDN